MKKYPVGLLVGRFQPFHCGHLYLIKEALKQVDTIVIGIGSSNIHDESNPLSYLTRKKMIEEMIQHEGLENKVLNTVPLKDYFNDEKWYKGTVQRVGHIDIIIGNNEWVNGIFEKRGHKILRVNFYKRYILEGLKIRELLKRKEKWQDRVPDYLIKIINKKL